MNAGGLTRRVGIVACGRAATTLSIFGVNAILTRAWDGAGFGTFTVVWVLGNTLVPVFLLGMPTALLYFFPRRRPNERTTLVLQVAGCLLLSAGVLALLLVVAGPTIAHLLNIEAQSASLDLSSYLWPFLPYVVSLVAGGYVESVLIAAGRPLRQATLSIIWAAALIAVSLVVAAFGLEVREALLALSAVGICRFVVGSAMAIQAVASHSKTDWTIAAFAEVISYSLPIALNDTVGSLSRSVDRLVVLYFFSAETLGMYHVGAIEVPISLLLTAVVTVLIPEVSRLHGEGDTVENLPALEAVRVALVHGHHAPLLLPVRFRRTYHRHLSAPGVRILPSRFSASFSWRFPSGAPFTIRFSSAWVGRAGRCGPASGICV